MTKKIILLIIIIILIVIIYQVALKKEEATFTLIEVVRGEIAQEVSETGQVQKGDKVNLSFENAGKIEKIYVEVGEEIERGKTLAKLDITDFQIELEEAKSALSIAQAKLDKLLTGATPQEVKVAQTKVENYQISLDAAKQDLNDEYEDALNVLDDSYLKAYNSQNSVSLIQRTYFTTNDQEGLRVRENKDKIESSVSKIKAHLDETKANPTQEKIDFALSQINNELSDIFDSLKIIREACEEPNYYNVVSSTSKSSLDTHRTNLNTALTNIVNSQQSITSSKLAIDSAKGELQTVKDELALLTAPPRQEDVDLYEAQVNQVKAEVKVLENKIEKAYLKSSVKGQVAEIKKKEGEMVQPMLQDVVIVLLPDVDFEIEVDIYEEDIVKIDIDDPVEISLVAFPEKTFQGRVISIEPAEKIVEGVVYYEVVIIFEETPEKIKPGMSADLIIKTAEKKDVLIIPEDAIQERDDKIVVEVFKDETIEEKEIEIGLSGSNDMVEVISGLEEGEEIILR